MARRERQAWLALVLATAPGALWADPPRPAHPVAPPVEDEFLEFLGSVDSDTTQPEELWLMDFLSKTDAGKAARPPGAPPPGPAQPAPAPHANAPQNNG